MTEKTDYELLKGDSDDFTELYTRYSRSTESFLYIHKLVRNPSDYADILQLIWIRVYAIRDKYDPHWVFGTWISQVASSTALNFYRDQGRTLPVKTNQSLDRVLDYRESGDLLVVQETVEKVRKEVAALPENAREAIEKVFFSSTYFSTGEYHQGYKRARRLLKFPLRPLYNELSET